MTMIPKLPLTPTPTPTPILTNKAWASRVIASVALLMSGLLFAGYVIAADWPHWLFVAGFVAAGNGVIFTPLALLGWRDDAKKRKRRQRPTVTPS